MNKKMPAGSWVMRWPALLFLTVFLFSCSASKHSSKTNDAKLSAAAVKEKYAAMLHVSVSRLDNARLYKFIDEWWGVPYRYGGNTRSGVDCSGLVVQLYKNVYGKNFVRTSLQQYEHSEHIKKQSKLKEGDLVFFTTRKDKKVSHVGIYLINDYFVHANNNGVTINNLHDPYWEPRYISGGRIKED